ncbi:MAG: hypothetical protein ACP5FH_02500, partial [Terracidiphilus sp.]
MRNILLIARREYLEQIRGRAFKFSTVLMPLLIALLLGASYLTNRNADADRHIAIVSNDDVLARNVRNRLENDENAKIAADVISPAAGRELAALKEQVENKSLDGILAIDTAGAEPTATYTSEAAGDLETTDQLQFALNRGLLDER